MPNLTSYRAPAIHLNRELRKTYCDLIRHETDYHQFLRTRVANIHSSLSSTNKRQSLQKKNIPSRRSFDHNQRLFNVYQHNLQLCKKILHIWTNNGKQQGGVDCHNENYKKQFNISHFRLRQTRWKDKIERENQRLIHSLIYHRKNYRSLHDRATAQEAYKKHLKLLQTMSQYPKYILTNPIHENLLDYAFFTDQIRYNFSEFYSLNPNISLQGQCRTLPRSYKFTKQKSTTIKRRLRQQTTTNTSPTYIQHLLQRTINDAVYIYNQPLPTASNHVKPSFSENSPWLKSRMYRQQELFQSTSCRQLLEPWRCTQQQNKTSRSLIADDRIANETSRFINTYNRIRQPKSAGINEHLSNSFSLKEINHQSYFTSEQINDGH